MSTMLFPLRVRPSRVAGERDLPALETAMQGLALDERSPIALEIAATTTTRHFLLRAEQQVALTHLHQQIQARYPQALIEPMDADPLMLASGEECSVVELRPGAVSSLPLRTWRAREWLSAGTDPLLGLLAACRGVPEGMRAIAQLALVPAAPTWSASHRRLAVEQSREQERHLTRQRVQGPTMAQLVLLVPVVGVLLLFYAFRRSIPRWVLQAGALVLRGHAPHLTAGQVLAVGVGIGGLLLLLVLGVGIASLIGRVGAPPIHDQHLVEEKTARSAYRVRLRLVVIGPGASDATRPVLSAAHLSKRLWQALRVCVLLGRAGRHTWRSHVRTVRRWLSEQWRLSQEKRTRRLAREDVLRMLTASYRQYHLAAGGYFVPRRVSTRRARALLTTAHGWFGFLGHAGWTRGLRHSTHYLSVADLAALWHLPHAQDLPDLSYVEQASVRTLLAPALLSTGDGYPLGFSTHAGQTVPVYFPFSCLRHHLLIVASTGKGKSTLLEHLAHTLILARTSGHPEGQRGLLFIDPHGDQVEHICGSLPASVRDEVVLLRLADQEYPIGFNPLDLSQGQDRDQVIDHLIQVIEALWPTSYGPRTESFVEYSCKTLAEANLTLLANDPLHGPDQQYTLLDVVPLLRQERFRHAVFELVQDQSLLSWWKDYYEQLDGRQQAEFTSSVVTKFSKFASSRLSRRILGQPRSSFSFADLIRQEKIILLSCAAGEVGADTARLFGSLLVGFFHTTLAAQARLHPTERHRFLVLLDEFQTLSVDYQTMLAELRKYGGSFALATQSLAYLDRLERTLRATVLANIDQVFAFAMAHEDARLLHVPGIEPEDLVHLPDYVCYARLALAGQRLPLFSLHLHAPKPVTEARQRSIASQCRLRYGRPRGDVDQMLLASEMRQQTMKPTRTRKGAKGYEVLWSGTGEARVQEVLDAMPTHHGGRGKGKGKRPLAEDGPPPPPHTMYLPSTELSEHMIDGVKAEKALKGGETEEEADAT